MYAVYAIERSTAVLYLAAEYGHQRAVALSRNLTRDAHGYRLPVPMLRCRKADAERHAARAMQWVAWQQGRLGRPLSGMIRAVRA